MSKSDHARPPKDPWARFLQQDRASEQHWDRRRNPRVLTDEALIQEGLMAMIDEDEPALIDLKQVSWADLNRLHGEALELNELLTVETHVPTAEHQRECPDCAHDWAMSHTDWDEWPDRDEELWDDEPTDWTPFLPCLSISDAYREFGDDGWHIEGKASAAPMWNEENRRAHYYRVWELARACNLTSKEMVKHLRLNKEYVHNHFSLVALPVADWVIADLNGQAYTQDQDREQSDDLLSQLRRMLS